MKTDKQLLQLAAKAVGYETKEDKHSGQIRVKINGLWPLFNPLTDDARALRLAVDFEFDITPMGYYVVVTDIGGHTTEQEYGNDKHAATRRAIVRAAAAIGEGME